MIYICLSEMRFCLQHKLELYQSCMSQDLGGRYGRINLCLFQQYFSHVRMMGG